MIYIDTDRMNRYYCGHIKDYYVIFQPHNKLRITLMNIINGQYYQYTIYYSLTQRKKLTRKAFVMNDHFIAHKWFKLLQFGLDVGINCGEFVKLLKISCMNQFIHIATALLGDSCIIGLTRLICSPHIPFSICNSPGVSTFEFIPLQWTALMYEY